MDQLATLCTDGHKYYCFIQVKETLFPLIPKSTVKNWLRELKIKCTSCSEEERTFFKDKIPSLSGAFGKISSSDLESLFEYSKYKKKSNTLSMTRTTSLVPDRLMPLPTTSTSTAALLQPTTTSVQPTSPFNTSRTSNTNFGTSAYVQPTSPFNTSRTSTTNFGTPTHVQPTSPFNTSRTCTTNFGALGIGSTTVQPTSPSNNSQSTAALLPTTSSCKPTSSSTGTDIEQVGVKIVNEFNFQPEQSNLTCLDRERIVSSSGRFLEAEFSDKTTEHNMGGGTHVSKQKPSILSEQMLENSFATTSSKETLSIGNCNSFSLSEERVETNLNALQSTPINRGGNPKIRYSLSNEHVTPELKQEFEKLNHFYMSGINPSRKGSKLSESTFEKLNERLLCFLGFVKRTNPSTKLSVSLTSSLELVESFVDYLAKGRKLMASTISRSLSALVSVIKYDHHRHVSDIEKLPAMIAIRNMQSQLYGEENLTRKRKREGFSSQKDRQLLFSHILDTLRQLREQFYNSSGLSSSRHLHDFTMLSLYTRAQPGRAKEMRTLLLIDKSNSEKPFSTENVDELNALVLQPDGSLILIESDFKTVKHTGPSKIDLTDDEWLVYFIKTYISKHRLALMNGKQHDYVFFNRNGDPFLGCGSLSKYLGDLFEREVEIRASTNKMRHAIVTYVMSAPESDNIKLRESFASLLKHSVRHQQKTYNDQRRQEKVEISRNFMRKSIADGDPYGAEEGEMSSIKSSLQEGSDDEDLLPLVGEICALLDPASTAQNNAFIFVAKVLRYTPDKQRVCLQEMEKLPDSTDLYHVKCSSTWWENVECLCYPIDIVYVASEKAYHLRTTAEQVYIDVTRK